MITNFNQPPSTDPFILFKILSDNKKTAVDQAQHQIEDSINDLKESFTSGEDVSSSDNDFDIGDYVNGLFTNQGNENRLNRDFNSAQAALNRQFQSDEARLQREWYESMTNTAYQRAVIDMKKAGLNPILAYSQGGAASSGTGIPGGSAAAYTATGGDNLSSLLSAAADVIGAVAGSSASNVNKAFKVFKFFR